MKNSNNRRRASVGNTISLQLPGKKAPFSQLKKILDEAVKKISVAPESRTMSGLHYFIEATEKRKRNKCIEALVDYKLPLKFADDFPFTIKELAAYVKVNAYLQQPRQELQKVIQPYRFPNILTEDNYTSRAQAKKKQLAEFDPESVKARRIIAEYKLSRITEAQIAKKLNKEDKLRTRNGSEYKQGQVNRLFKRHLEIWDNLLPVDSGGPAHFLHDTLAIRTDLVQNADHSDSPTPLFDRSVMKPSEEDRAHDLTSPDYFPDVTIAVKGLEHYPHDRLYLKFTNAKQDIVESFSLMTSAMEHGVAILNIPEDSILRSDFYRLELFDENGLLTNKPIDMMNISIGLKHNSSETVEMFRSKHTNKIVMSYRDY